MSNRRHLQVVRDEKKKKKPKLRCPKCGSKKIKERTYDNGDVLRICRTCKFPSLQEAQ